ncbi:MAG: efflux RND transporter permease subunit [Sandaracinaceae bacterium]|nr:efflux RND transporter permease subunit [Sandaracinaceae bacterium]
MRALVHLCLQQRFVVMGLALVLVAVGAVLTRDASFDAFPEFAPPRVEIQTEAPGLSSEEVESLVTTPLEAVLAGTPGMTEMRSRSVLGLSSVVLVLDRGADLMETRALVGERVARARLPALASPPVLLSPLSSTSRVLKVAVWSETRSQMELTDLVRWVVRPRLMSVPGVANVAIWGERNRQLQVQVDPVRTQAYGLTLDEVVLASRQAVTPLPGGFVDGPNQRLPVLHRSLVSTPEELARVPVGVRADRSLTLGDVARVVEDHPPPIGEAVVTHGAGLLLIVEKQPGANTLEVTHGVEEALAQLAPALPGVEVDPTVFRPAGFIERALSNLGEAMAIGTALVILVLLVFLWDWRTAVISVVAIPISLLAAASILTLAGFSLDTMVIAGLIIALGEVVDDAIIDVENIHRRLREAPPDRTFAQTLRIVLDASLEVRSAVVYATLIVTLVFVPVLFLPGVAGEFFRPLALGYGLAVLASMAVALTLTPVLALLLLPGHLGERREPPLAHRLRGAYEKLLSATLRRPRLVIASSALAVLASVGALGTLEEEFLPHFAENDFLMHWIGRPGTSLSAMARTADLARAELLTVEGVRSFGAHIGRAEVADEVVGPNFAELWISVDPDADLDATLAEVRAVVGGYPGVYRDVQTYLQERMREVLSGGSGAIVVRLFGPDLEALEAHGVSLASELAAVEGVDHASPPAQVLVPQIEIVARLDRCAALGVDPGLIRRRATTLVQGERVGTIVRGQQPVDVVVWSPEAVRDDVAALRELLIDVDATRSVRLGDVARVRVTEMPNTIAHQAGSRKVDISVTLEEGADLGAVARRIEERVAAHALPAGHHAETLGEYRAREEAQRTLLSVGALSLFGVFLILLADFRSFRMTALVMTSLPLALIGGVLVTALAGGVVSLGTLVGLVTVLGIASRNGILLVAHYRHLEEVEGMTFGPALILRGASERLSPILMTALSTGLALVPLVVAGSDAGHEIEHPMAVVILGGLVSSTLLNLFAMPVVVLLSRRRNA